MQAVRNPRKVCSRLGFAFAAMLVVVLGAQLLLTLLAYTWAPWFIANETGSWLLADASIYLFGAPVYLLILRSIPNGREGPREKLRMNPWKYLLLLVVCLGVAYAASFVTVLFLLFVESFKNSPIQTPELFAESNFFIALFFGSVVPALGEEYLFRYCLRKKLKGAGDKIYILFSALCFAVFHMNMSQLVFTFFVGAILAWVYTQTGNIWYSVSLHFCFNTVSLLLTLVEEEFFSVMIAWVGAMFAFIAISVTTLVLSMRYVRSHLRPPEEAGWPYKAPRERQMQNHPAYPAVYGQPYQPIYGGMPGYGLAQQAPYTASQLQYAPPGAYHQPGYGYQNHQPPYAPQPYAPQAYTPPYTPQGQPHYPGQPGAYGGPVPPVYGYGTPAPPFRAEIPELAWAGYNNMPGGSTPPAYQNMRPVWPGEGRNGTAAYPPLAGLPGGPGGGSILKTCFLNPGMILYLLGGLIVIVLSMLL